MEYLGLISLEMPCFAIAYHRYLDKFWLCPPTTVIQISICNHCDVQDRSLLCSLTKKIMLVYYFFQNLVIFMKFSASAPGIIELNDIAICFILSMYRFLRYNHINLTDDSFYMNYRVEKL